MRQEIITFSFGKNWESFISTVSDEQVRSALLDIEQWLGREKITGKTILDIGCGSGIHSLAFLMLGAERIDSFDYDISSVNATRSLWERNAKSERWNIFQGSILDTGFTGRLPAYDIVYAWGVLHHTGDMWSAINNAAALVRDGGYLWISIYVKGPRYSSHLQLKKRYNAASALGKWWMETVFIIKIMGWRALNLKNPFAWNEKKSRGMDTYHDIVDWLGGLPYEVASEDEVVRFCLERSFVLYRIKVIGEGGCNVYVFRKLQSAAICP